MSNQTRERTRRRSLGSILGTGWRVLLDGVVVALWVLVVVLAFLATGWPPWAFYAGLLAGVFLYVWLTNAL